MRQTLLAAVMLFAAVSLSAQQASSPMPVAPPPSIITSAQGEARVTPDRATIYIGVETHAATAAQASTANAQKQRAVIDTLHALGIGNDQISTTNYNVYPQQSFQPDKGDKVPKVVGYNVTNTVRVEVRKLEQLGTLLDAVLTKGANAINSLEFYSSNQDEARRSALTMAVARARGDAEALAKGAGGHLGELLEVSSAPMSLPPRPYPMAMRMEMAKGADSTPIAPGEQTLNVNVTATWRFLPDGR